MEAEKNSENIPELPNNNADFAKKIEESKIAIQTAETPKKGPGRPRKHPKPVAQTASHTSLHSTPESASSGVSIPAPNIATYVKYPLITISKIPAVKYQIPELQLTEDEAGACAESLNQVIQAFVPDVGKMDPKTASVVGALAVFGSIGIQKYQILQAKKKTEDKKPDSEAQAKNAEIQATAGIEPDGYFSRQAM